MEKVIVKDLGIVDYKETWDLQQTLLKEVIEIKRRKEKTGEEAKHYFLLCEHSPVYTLGRSGNKENLLLNDAELKEKSIDFYKINRGGDITYHGPGQVVGYPILDLDCFFTDIHKFVRYIEEAVIRLLAEYGIEGERIEGASGVWLKAGNGKPDRKICAIGIHLSRWVTMHGFAFNANTELSYFTNIIPCGITDKGVTSLASELGREVDIQKIKEGLSRHFSVLFEYEIA